MTITYTGALPLTLALGAAVIISATMPPVQGSSVTLTYDGTPQSLQFDPAAIGNPSSAFLSLPIVATPLFAGLVADATAARLARQALDADVVKALGVSDTAADTIAGVIIDDSLKAKP